ncbi:MAG: transporter [Lentisphaeria bacterium]|jgi:hypothetical protein|nr:transporter [Lentisphaerota bacterium]
MIRKLWTGVIVAATVIGIHSAKAEGLTLKQQARLINTETAVLVPQGNLELSLGADYLKHARKRQFTNNWSRSKNRDKARIYDWSVSLRGGVTENLDAFISTSWTDIKDKSYPYGDRYARGIDDVSLGVKYGIIQDQDDFLLSYQPSITIPANQYKAESGRLGPGNNYWSFDQTLAATFFWDDFSGSAALTQTIPFARGRHHYSTTFLQEQRRTRGTTGVDLGLTYEACEYLQPLVELNYLHEWLSKGNDSDLLATTLGAKANICERGQILAGYQYPITGRNSFRGSSIKVGLVALF